HHRRPIEQRQLLEPASVRMCAVAVAMATVVTMNAMPMAEAVGRAQRRRQDRKQGAKGEDGQEDRFQCGWWCTPRQIGCQQTRRMVKLLSCAALQAPARRLGGWFVLGVVAAVIELGV